MIFDSLLILLNFSIFYSLKHKEEVATIAFGSKLFKKKVTMLVMNS